MQTNSMNKMLMRILNEINCVLLMSYKSMDENWDVLTIEPIWIFSNRIKHDWNRFRFGLKRVNSMSKATVCASIQLRDRSRFKLEDIYFLSITAFWASYGVSNGQYRCLRDFGLDYVDIWKNRKKNFYLSSHKKTLKVVNKKF